MASLHRHKQHGWRITYNLYFPDGSHKIKYKTACLKTKAQELLQQITQLEILSMSNRLTHEERIYFMHLRCINKEDLSRLTSHRVITKKITWDYLDDIYRKHLKTVGSIATQEKGPYKSRPILAYFKEIIPESMTVEMIRDYVTHRRNTVSKATVSKEIVILRVMYDHLVESGIVHANPARQVKLLGHLPERMPRCLSPAELQSILKKISLCNYCYGYFPEIIYSYLFTGCRRYELLNLKTHDIDFKKKLIRVHGKGDKERMIEMHPQLDIIFKRVVKTNKGEGLFFFGGKDKPLMSGDAVGRAFRVFLKDNGLYNKDISLHTLRHTFCSYLLDSGVPIRKVQELMGHSSLKTTLKYTHVIPSEESFIKKLDYEKYSLQKTTLKVP